MKRLTSLVDRSLQPILPQLAHLPHRLKLDRLRAAAVDPRVPRKVLLRRAEQLARRSA